MGLADRMAAVTAADNEDTRIIQWARRKQGILLELRAVVAFSNTERAKMPALPPQQPTASAAKCLTCSAPAAANVSTGLCLKCHGSAKKLVEKGMTTWDELVLMGLAAASGMSTADSFTQAFLRKKKGP